MTREVRPWPNGNSNSIRQPLTLIDLERDLDHLPAPVIDRDVQIACLRLEDLHQPRSDELDDRIEVELLRQGRADLVDEGELRVPLLRLAEQPLRLIEQAGVLQGDAEAGGDRAEQAFVRLGEPVRLESLE